MPPIVSEPANAQLSSLKSRYNPGPSKLWSAIIIASDQCPDLTLFPKKKKKKKKEEKKRKRKKGIL
jgi:hypothetical protein